MMPSVIACLWFNPWRNVVSTAVTDQKMCVDGLEGMGSVDAGKVKSMTQRSSNTICLVCVQQRRHMRMMCVLLFFLSGIYSDGNMLRDYLHGRINKVVAELLWLKLVWLIDWWAGVKIIPSSSSYLFIYLYSFSVVVVDCTLVQTAKYCLLVLNFVCYLF